MLFYLLVRASAHALTHGDCAISAWTRVWCITRLEIGVPVSSEAAQGTEALPGRQLREIKPPDIKLQTWCSQLDHRIKTRNENLISVRPCVRPKAPQVGLGLMSARLFQAEDDYNLWCCKRLNTQATIKSLP